ncbi:MAG TPA: DNA polymerase III subunit delta' [Burkholderiales bacterium]
MEEIGFPWIAASLARLPANIKNLPGALLLGGQPGLGKRTTALFLARAVLCETSRDGWGACGTCASCHLVAAGNHPDLRVVELATEEEQPGEEETASSSKKPSKQISVDRIRSLGEFVTTTAYRGRAKVIVISPAEAMHPAAANAVLKILEEPPGNTYFLLVSHQPDRLLPTIRSRCFQVPFALPAPDAALEWLKGRGIEQPELALAQGGYAPLAAIEKAESPEYWTQRKALLDALARPGFNPVVAAERAEPIEGPVLAGLLQQWAYDIAAIKSGGTVRYHLDFRNALEKLATEAGPEALMAWYDTVIQYGRVSQHPLNKRLAVEGLLAGYPGLH